MARLKNLKKRSKTLGNRTMDMDYLDWFDGVMLDLHEHRFDNPESRKNNLEWDLLTTEWILEKARGRQDYAQNIYAALCNTDWQKLDVMEILKEQTWSCSWRAAGGIVAGMLGQGDYLDWYCSGMGGISDYDIEESQRTMDQNKFVPEGTVTDEIVQDFGRLGWVLKR